MSRTLTRAKLWRYTEISPAPGRCRYITSSPRSSNEHLCHRRSSMGSSVDREDDNRLRTPPAPTELARRLLTDEAGEHQSPEEVAAAATRAYERLRERLTVFLGQQGFDSLWARAMYLAQRQFRSW